MDRLLFIQQGWAPPPAGYQPQPTYGMGALFVLRTLRLALAVLCII